MPENSKMLHEKIQQVFATLIDLNDIFDEDKIESVQEFTCRMYGMNNCQSVNTGRFIMFNKIYAAKENNEKFIKKIKGLDSTHILPCWKSLKQKMLRTIFVNYMWLNATEFDCLKFSAENNGWLFLDGFLKPTWFLGSSTPIQVENVLCNSANKSSDDEEHSDCDGDSDNCDYESNEESDFD
ncbi:unnamed protein product [Parnassius apollo]|uniref:(apollo) hypothetical protein n=1 Tax=Parnassius apollo TaxID=110799 RepID=A0A8S3XCD7_PARAO|nr:unnamed protein product [Parnassius apollo]